MAYNRTAPYAPGTSPGVRTAQDTETTLSGIHDFQDVQDVHGMPYARSAPNAPRATQPFHPLAGDVPPGGQGYGGQAYGGSGFGGQGQGGHEQGGHGYGGPGYGDERYGDVGFGGREHGGSTFTGGYAGSGYGAAGSGPAGYGGSSGHDVSGYDASGYDEWGYGAPSGPGHAGGIGGYEYEGGIGGPGAGDIAAVAAPADTWRAPSHTADQAPGPDHARAADGMRTVDDVRDYDAGTRPGDAFFRDSDFRDSDFRDSGDARASWDAGDDRDGPEYMDDGEPAGEWNPSADSLPFRGRHRIMRRGGLARSSTVLGVGVIAAVGAGGIASADGGKPPVHVSVPDLSSVTSALDGHAKSLPLVGRLLPDATPSADGAGSETPLTGAGVTAAEAKQGASTAGEALRNRILQQAEQQQDQADSAVKQAAEKAAAKKAAEEAAQQKAAAERKAAAAKKAAEEAARRKAEAERLAELARSYTLPVSSYTLTSRFGDPGAMWSSGFHTGLDFAAPTGTPIKAVHSGTVKEAGWSGAYGYRTVLQLDNGTELWFCHQSSINVNVGQSVTTGQIIGRVGATGNVTGPHLHLEVHPGGGAAEDPMPWLEMKGLNP